MSFNSEIRPPSPGHSNKKVIVGMSGGVDSSVSALLLQQQGFHVEGLFMKNWNEDDGTEYCTAAKDLLDAAAVCQKLNIHLHTANFASEYWDNVFEHFLEEYKAGRTPNPDILCNREIKFKVFIEFAKNLGADYIATGHYANTRKENSHTLLCKGKDTNKDQSYFLHAVSESEFSKTLFPIGNIEKSQVREIAEQHGLVTHNKKDSTGICFIGERRFKDFLETYLPAQPGDIIDDKDTVIGQHQGLMYHTIGQRQGLGIGGVAGAKEEPWYVAEKLLDTNQLRVVQGSNHPLLFHNTLFASQVHWINNLAPEEGMRCKAKTRYRQADQECVLNYIKDDGSKNDDSKNHDSISEDSENDATASHFSSQIKVTFQDAQRAITPGQSVVFYQGDVCLGGAVIERAVNL